MDAKSIGAVISKLRKKCGLTQLQLAEQLNVSDKTISRWENGLGYPEVTQFPVLASIFGVTVDYLMSGERKGITIAGNILADVVKNIDCYPEKGTLSNISEITRAVGGCVPNTAINVAKIDKDIPLTAIGKIGDDEYGRYVVSQMKKYGIDCDKISISENRPTSFSDVMSEPSGERTFFHARGANVEFAPEDIDITSLNSVILHIGYILLLDVFDEYDSEYGTVMARFLHDAQEHGLKTSIDVVSDYTADYRAKLVPALKYCDYAILNEYECCRAVGVSPNKENGELDVENIRKAMEAMADYGVKEKIIIHCKQAGFCLDVPTREFTVVPSLKIPSEEIMGSVGAGDAFCAASLYGIYTGMSDYDILHFASAAAACNLFAANSIDGMKTCDEIKEIANKYPRREL